MRLVGMFGASEKLNTCMGSRFEGEVGVYPLIRRRKRGNARVAECAVSTGELFSGMKGGENDEVVGSEEKLGRSAPR